MPAEKPDLPLPNSYWVLPGKFLAGEHPCRGADTPVEVRERLRLLMDAGIDCFVDLTMPDELYDYEPDLPPGVQYMRRPIRDHSIPAQREHMVETLAHIARALRAKRRVYVHCHAGIGRTGTVAGCFLVERGSTGDEAIDELNRLWQQCERAQSWPYVPETEDQTDFVRKWKSAGGDPAAQLAAIPLKATANVYDRAAQGLAFARIAPERNLRDRFHGALLGLAVGDALAAATQGRKPGTFTPIKGFEGGGAFELPPGAWTDDTAMALCLAESLLERKTFDVHDQVERYRRWQSQGYLSATGQCVGITSNTARALSAAQWRRQVFAGSHDPKQLDPEVLSRIAPAVMFGFGSPEEALRMACDSARSTCQAPLALDACQLFAAILYGALADEPKERILRPSPKVLDLAALRPKVSALLTQAEGTDRSKPPRATGLIVDALSAALWAFTTTENFHDGALQAANLGGHSDTVASAYGQLAGAHYGAHSIPAAWRKGLVKEALIAGFADRLLAHAQRQVIQ